MAELNKVFLIGNLAQDPEVKYLPSGMAVADLRLAVNERYKNKSGEVVESTIFLDVVVWSRQAEVCGEYLTKGSPIFVEGRLQMDTWKTQQGENRSRLRVRSDRIQFLPRSGQGPSQGSGGSAPTYQQQQPAQAPIQQAPMQQAPMQQAPMQQAPVQQAPMQQDPMQQDPMQQDPDNLPF